MIFFDRDKLEKIVTNLLANAFKFTPEGGRVIVDVSISDFGFRISDLKEQGKSEIPNPK
jgi:signal transduction histidine kinase